MHISSSSSSSSSSTSRSFSPSISKRNSSQKVNKSEHSLAWTLTCPTRYCHGKLQYVSNATSKIPQISCSNNDSLLSEQLKPLDTYITGKIPLSQIKSTANRRITNLLETLKKQIGDFYKKIPQQQHCLTRKPDYIINPAIRRSSDCQFERFVIPSPTVELIKQGPTYVGLGNKTPSFGVKQLPAKCLLDGKTTNNFKRIIQEDFGVGQYTNKYWFSPSLPKLINCPPDTHELTPNQSKVLNYISKNQDRLPLEIRQSSIPNAGKGVFALTDIPANVGIMLYIGPQQTPFESWPPSDSIYDLGWISQDNADNIMPLVIEPTRKLNAARYINTGITSKENNCNIQKLFWKGQIALLISTARGISNGEEIFYDYGSLYGFSQNFEKVLNPAIYSRFLADANTKMTRSMKKRIQNDLAKWNLMIEQDVDASSVSSYKPDSNQSHENVDVQDRQPTIENTNSVPWPAIKDETFANRRSRTLVQRFGRQRGHYNKILDHFFKMKRLTYKKRYPRMRVDQLETKIHTEWEGLSIEQINQRFLENNPYGAFDSSKSQSAVSSQSSPSKKSSHSRLSKRSLPKSIQSQISKRSQSESPKKVELHSLETRKKLSEKYDYGTILAAYRKQNGPQSTETGEKPNLQAMVEFLQQSYSKKIQKAAPSKAVMGLYQPGLKRSNSEEKYMLGLYMQSDGPEFMPDGSKPDYDDMVQFLGIRIPDSPKSVQRGYPVREAPTYKHTTRVFVEQDSDFERYEKKDFEMSDSEEEKPKPRAHFSRDPTDRNSLRHLRRTFRELLQIRFAGFENEDNQLIGFNQSQRFDLTGRQITSRFFKLIPMQKSQRGLNFIDKYDCNMCRDRINEGRTINHFKAKHPHIYWAVFIQHHLRKDQTVDFWIQTVQEGLYNPSRWNIIKAINSRSGRDKKIKQVQTQGHCVSSRTVIVAHVFIGNTEFKYKNINCPCRYSDDKDSKPKKESLRGKKKQKKCPKSQSSSSSSIEEVIYSFESPPSDPNNSDSSESDSFGHGKPCRKGIHYHEKPIQKKSDQCQQISNQNEPHVYVDGEAQMVNLDAQPTYISVDEELVSYESISSESAQVFRRFPHRRWQTRALRGQETPSNIEESSDSVRIIEQPMGMDVEHSSESVQIIELPLIEQPSVQQAGGSDSVHGFQFIERPFVQMSVQQLQAHNDDLIVRQRQLHLQSEERHASQQLERQHDQIREQTSALFQRRLAEMRVLANHSISYRNLNPHQIHQRQIAQQEIINIIARRRDQLVWQSAAFERARAELALEQAQNRIRLLSNNASSNRMIEREMFPALLPLQQPIRPVQPQLLINDPLQNMIMIQERCELIYQRMGISRQYPVIAPANPPQHLTLEQAEWCYQIDDRNHIIGEWMQSQHSSGDHECPICYQFLGKNHSELILHERNFDAIHQGQLTRQHYEEFSKYGRDHLIGAFIEYYSIINRVQLSQCTACRKVLHRECYKSSSKYAVEALAHLPIETVIDVIELKCPLCRGVNKVMPLQTIAYPQVGLHR